MEQYGPALAVKPLDGSYRLQQNEVQVRVLVGILAVDQMHLDVRNVAADVVLTDPAQRHHGINIAGEFP